jgi:hypothetical protein
MECQGSKPRVKTVWCPIHCSKARIVQNRKAGTGRDQSRHRERQDQPGRRKIAVPEPIPALDRETDRNRQRRQYGVQDQESGTRPNRRRAEIDRKRCDQAEPDRQARHAGPFRRRQRRYTPQRAGNGFRPSIADEFFGEADRAESRAEHDNPKHQADGHPGPNAVPR